MSQKIICPEEFSQPIGKWRRRGAPESYIQLAIGAIVNSWPSQLNPDNLGYGVWHYWAEGPKPELLWDDLRMHIGDKHDFKIANNGEHPLYRLIIKDKSEAALQWLEQAKWPIDTKVNGDDLWHALAWNGNYETFKKLHLFLSPNNINSQDINKLTGASIAVHRGGIEALKQWLFLGADPDIQDDYGRTVLHHVAQYGDISWFTEIQDMGASDKIKNEKNQTPIDVLYDRMKHSTAIDIEIMQNHWFKRYLEKIIM